MAQQPGGVGFDFLSFESMFEHHEGFKDLIERILRAQDKHVRIDDEIQDVEEMQREIFQPTRQLLSSFRNEISTTTNNIVYQAPLLDVSEQRINGYLVLGKDGIKVKMHTSHFLMSNNDPLLSGERADEESPLPFQLKGPLKEHTEEEIKRMTGVHYPEFIQTELPQKSESVWDHWKSLDMRAIENLRPEASRTREIFQFPNEVPYTTVVIPMSSEINELGELSAQQLDPMGRRRPRKSLM
ncbi:unnamed protein product [Orchesella dallaii]|uniref:Uncharacterized protein n=1 Tax=Orchesella dallaii TaxID=48710 RepID=A0ABP1Q1E9_9HEXA